MEDQLKEILRYGISGVLATVANLLFLKIFIDMGMYYIFANTISYIIGVILSYILNQKYVFLNSDKHNKKKQFTVFFIMRVLSLIIDNILFYILVTILDFPIYWTRFVLTLIMILVTFIFNKWYIFASKN